MTMTQGFILGKSFKKLAIRIGQYLPNLVSSILICQKQFLEDFFKNNFIREGLNNNNNNFLMDLAHASQKK